MMFLFAPETAHSLTVSILKFVLAIPLVSSIFKSIYSVSANENKKINLLGLDFKNRVGLAAGFDKDGKYFDAMTHLGFGFVEIGTVTPRPQSGNPQPRLFRLKQDQALINRMGFNNDGVDALAQRLKDKKDKIGDVIIGGNIGKNKDTPNENAVDDYLYCFKALHGLVDYFVVNVSSPNTPGLRQLQDKAPLTALLTTLQNENTKYTSQTPIFLKIAPDLTENQLDDIIDIVATTKIEGLIATNTTIDRSGLTQSTDEIGAGGLSGAPLTQRNTEIIDYLRQRLPTETIIIGVGGIMNAQDAAAKIKAGADLLQIYTGLVYEGPGLVKAIVKEVG